MKGCTESFVVGAVINIYLLVISGVWLVYKNSGILSFMTLASREIKHSKRRK